MKTIQEQLPDGRVELVDLASIQRSPLYNHDLAPVPIARRTWSTYNYAALWMQCTAVSRQATTHRLQPMQASASTWATTL